MELQREDDRRIECKRGRGDGEEKRRVKRREEKRREEENRLWKGLNEIKHALFDRNAFYNNYMS